MESDIISPKFFTTFQTAKLLGVDMGTVIDWCQQGKLSAFKTPGGHRRIKPTDLLAFLRHFRMPIPSSLARIATLKCLIVDDHADIRRMVARVIKGIDDKAEVEQAEDGFEAGKKALESLPHLIVLDLGLPGVDGVNVCQSIRRDDRFNLTKILAISGANVADGRRKVLDAGANDFLAKPFDVKELKAHITKLLSLE